MCFTQNIEISTPLFFYESDSFESDRWTRQPDTTTTIISTSACSQSSHSLRERWSRPLSSSVWGSGPGIKLSIRSNAGDYKPPIMGYKSLV